MRAVKKRNSRSAIALPSTEPKASRSRSNSFTPTLTGTLIALRSSSHTLAWWTVSSARAGPGHEARIPFGRIVHRLKVASMDHG